MAWNPYFWASGVYSFDPLCHISQSQMTAQVTACHRTFWVHLALDLPVGHFRVIMAPLV